MRSLITGVAGFIGSTLAHRLLEDGHDVVGVDSFTDYYDREHKEQNLAPLREEGSFRFHERNLTDAPWDEMLHGVDAIFHQAGEPGVRGSWGSGFSRYTVNNIEATQRLLDSLTRKPHIRLVYASSSSVYGNAAVWPCREGQEPRPFSPYGVTKLAAEHLVRAYTANYGLTAVSLRYFTVFGPKQRPDMLMHRLCESLLGRRTVQIFGGGQQIRDFTYVDDVVSANILAAGLDRPGEEIVLNVCGGSAATVQDVIATLREIAGAQGDIQEGGEQVGDVARTGGDNAAARQLLKWSPSVPLAEGLRRQFEWHQLRANGG